MRENDRNDAISVLIERINEVRLHAGTDEEMRELMEKARRILAQTMAMSGRCLASVPNP